MPSASIAHHVQNGRPRSVRRCWRAGMADSPCAATTLPRSTTIKAHPTSCSTSCDEAPADFASSETATSLPLRIALNAARQSSVADAPAAASGTSGSAPATCMMRSLVAFTVVRSSMLAPWSDLAQANLPELAYGSLNLGVRSNVKRWCLNEHRRTCPAQRGALDGAAVLREGGPI